MHNFISLPRKAVLVGLMLGSASGGLCAQQSVPPPAPRAAPVEEDPDIIVTTAARQRGAVIGDIKPELQLGPADVRALGVSSITELLSELAPQTTSGRGGSPVVLLNGKRISGFNEVRDIPPEAIARVDILPEEVALKYGYTSDQKVVNIVLRQRFRAYTAEMNYGLATRGGAQVYQPEASFLRIRNGGRFNLELEYPIQDPLLESQRGVVSAPLARPYSLTGNVVDATGTVFGVLPSAAAHTPTSSDFSATPTAATDLTPYRTLTAGSKNFTANAVYNQTILDNVSATVNAKLDLSNTTSDNGLPTLALLIPTGNPFAPFANQPVTLYRSLTNYGPLTQNNKSVAAHLGATLNGDFSKAWHWSFTGNYDVSDTHTITQTGVSTASISGLLTANPTLNPYGPIASTILPISPANLTHALTNTGVVDLLVNGDLFKVPAGDVSTSFKIAAQNAVFDSEAQRTGVVLAPSHLRQGIARATFNMDVPLTNRKKHVLGALGDLSLNANVAYKYLTDFGTLNTLGYGLNWTPVTPLSVVVALTNDHAAPSVGQLSNPQVITPNALVFDPLTGQTEIVTQISGGNPALKASDRHVLDVEANYKPFSKTDLTLNATYTRINVNNLISSPTLAQSFATKTIDPTTGIAIINSSPTNFARAETEQLRWGINFSQPLKSKTPPQGATGRDQGRPGGDRPGGNRGGAGGARGGFGGFGQPGGRLQFAVYHTVFLRDTLLSKAGQPPLNLLAGDAAGSSGGQPRHQLELQAGFYKAGWPGVRLTANWQSATTVNGLTPTGTLHFGDKFSSSLRIFANLSGFPKLVKDHPFLRGSRILFVMNNIFDVRERVTDATGATPISYQPAYIDAKGRTVRIAFRKVFF